MTKLGEYIRGKWRAAARLSEFIRYLSNWREVWPAFRAGVALPEFHLRGGLKLTSGPEDDLYGIFHEVFVRRSYTRGFYNPQPGDTVIDVGANVGVFAVFLNWLTPGIQVHSFEPIKATRMRLERNIVVNRLQELVSIYPTAVAASSGTLPIYRGLSAGHSSMIANQFTDREVETVPCTDIKGALALARSERIQLLKIDVEGAEVDILSHVEPDTLSRVERVAVEYHDLFRPGSRESVIRALSMCGYNHIEDRPDLPNRQLGLIRASR